MLNTTIFTSPKRDEGIKGGKSSWRGNHPPTLSKAVFEWLRPQMIADPMCGSGTTGDVAGQKIAFYFCQAQTLQGKTVNNTEVADIFVELRRRNSRTYPESFERIRPLDGYLECLLQIFENA